MSALLIIVSYNLYRGKDIYKALNEGFMEVNFINPGRTTTKFDTVVILGEEFEINMFEDVSPSAAGHFVTQK